VRWIVVSLAILGAGLLVAACSSQPVDEHDRGVELAQDRLWEDAIAEFDTAIEVDPDPRTYLARGTAHGQIGFDLLLQDLDADGASEEFDLALADLNRAIELEPTLAVAWSERAAVHAQQLDFDLADQDLQAALAVVGDGPLRLGIAELIYQGDGDLPEGQLTPSLCGDLSTVEERLVVQDGEPTRVDMLIFSGDLTTEEKMECGVLLASGYSVTPLWERILD